MPANKELYPLPFVDTLLKILGFELEQETAISKIYFRKSDNTVLALDHKDNLNAGDIIEIASSLKMPPQPLFQHLRLVTAMFEMFKVWKQKLPDK